MWLSCIYSYTLLGFRSHSIASYIVITIAVFSNGKENSLLLFYSFF
jgi:hypothetical protein